MLKKFIILATISVIGFSCAVTPSFAETYKVTTSTPKAVSPEIDLVSLKAKLNEMYPSANISTISRTPVEGIYELVAGRNLMYTDKNGKYFIFGSIYDMTAQHDVSADRRAEINLVDIASLPIADAIKVVHGKGTHTLYVFSDPECPYCKRAEETLATVDDMTMYVFLMPIPQLHPSATALAEHLWCAEDKVLAWNNWMQKGVQPAVKYCDNPITRNQALAASMQVTGTPTFVREDGKIVTGAPSHETVQTYLSKE